MHRGYIKIWRKLEDSGLLQMHSTLALFMHMLMKATYKPCRVGMVELERGQLVTGRIKLAEAIGVSDRQIRTCLDRLHDLQIVTSKPTSHFTIYTIVNYNEYQDIDNSSDQQNDQPPTNNRPATDQPPTTIQEVNTLSIKKESNTITPKRKVKTKLPDVIEPTDSHIDFAKLNNLSIHDEMVKFRLHHEEKVTMSGSWNASFSKWLHNAVQFRRPSFTAKQDSLKRTGDLLTGRVREYDAFTIDVD